MDSSKSNSDYLSSKNRIRISDLKEAKRRNERWVMITSYDTISAKILDKAKIPVVLVGDSASQVVFGYKSTLQITLDEMIPLARAVSASCERALVIGDLPFGSFEESPQVALRSATRFMKEAQVQAIKIEGGKEVAEHVKLLTKSGIPVMGHIGFTPQSEHALGGFKVQGRKAGDAERLLEDALILQKAGAFAIVLELTSSPIAKMISEKLDIPLVGIGAGLHCDAQVLVWTDMVGFVKPAEAPGGYMADVSKKGDEMETNEPERLKLNRVPKFVKKYGNFSEILYEAALSFAEEVKNGVFPDQDHSFE